MIVYPAIDLLGGKVVRLRAGRREEATVYSDRPGEIARGFVRAGARRLHVVDLDGAFGDGAANRAAVAEILAGRAPVQLGGGVRDLAACAALLDGAGPDPTGAGPVVGPVVSSVRRVERVVLGTAMVKTPALVRAACARWPGRIVVAVDARDGKVAVEGWTEGTDVDATELAARAAGDGAAAILYTDIARDGLRTGPAVAATARLARAVPGVEVIASGGIAALDDLRALADAGVAAAVVGRALYDGVFTLAEARVAAGEELGC